LRRISYVLVLGAVAVSTGCGSGSTDKAPEAPAVSSAAATPAADSSAYRAAINDVFNQVVEARGMYQAAHGDTALRESAVALAAADRAGLAKLRTLTVPSSAKALQTRLVALLSKQVAALKQLLAAGKLDSGKLGDAVLTSNDAEGVVSQINALP
jgi:hypothetical protein